MTKAKITAAGKQYKKVYKLRGDLTKAQKKTLRVSKSRIAAIKQMVAVNTEIKAVLKDKRVIKDLTYSDDALQQTLTGLKSKYAKFVSQKQDDATLIHNEVAAIAKVKSSTTGDPDQAKIDPLRQRSMQSRLPPSRLFGHQRFQPLRTESWLLRKV